MIRDFFNKRKIRQETLEIIAEFIDEKEMEGLSKIDAKKAQKKLEKSVKKMKASLADYIRHQKLGLYGKSKVFKIVQDRLLELGMDSKLVNGIVKRIMFV